MNENNVFLYYDKELSYPGGEFSYSPSTRYPEYQFRDLSQENNEIYDAIRESFIQMQFDADHIGSKDWNPLGTIIHEGYQVLIKPNMVLHKNLVPDNGEECLYTNPSLVRCIVDYVLIALKGSGSVIIADAPVQSCDWNEFVNTSGYQKILNYYQAHNQPVQVLDLREYTAKVENGIVIREKRLDAPDGICINLGKKSALFHLTDKQQKKLRVTDYDPAIMNDHHKGDIQEYSVSKIAISADVIINMPKIKTHRLGGMTGALKNMVGINARKDYLPHHRLGDVSDGGDQHNSHMLLNSCIDRLLDRENNEIEKHEYLRAKFTIFFIKIFAKTRSIIYPNEATAGNWSGNDTIWRMVHDLNFIMYHSDKDGILKDSITRNIFTIGDMVVAGEGEGPLRPSPVKAGAILFGYNPLLFDCTAATLMGFDYHKIPQLEKNKSLSAEWGGTEIMLFS